MRYLQLNERRGSAMVEFALVAPLLVLILVGIMVMGVIINAQIVVSGAAREAGRTWSIAMDDATARAKAADAVIGGGLRVSDGNSVLFDANRDVRFQREGNYIRVTVTYRQPMLVPLIGQVLGRAEDDQLLLKSQAVFRVER